MKRPDCFAYARGTCTACNLISCGDCPFYKTFAEEAEELAAVHDRLKKLGLLQKEWDAKIF